MVRELYLDFKKTERERERLRGREEERSIWPHTILLDGTSRPQLSSVKPNSLPSSRAKMFQNNCGHWNVSPIPYHLPNSHPHTSPHTLPWYKLPCFSPFQFPLGPLELQTCSHFRAFAHAPQSKFYHSLSLSRVTSPRKLSWLLRLTWILLLYTPYSTQNLFFLRHLSQLSNYTFFYWSIVDLQYCVSFRYTAKGSYMFN